MKSKYEIKLSKQYNSFGYSIEGDLEDSEPLKYVCLLKVFDFMDEFEKLKDLNNEDRIKYVTNKLEKMKFLYVLKEGKWIKPEEQIKERWIKPEDKENR